MAALRFNRGQQAPGSNPISSARDGGANNPLASSAAAASTSGASKTSARMKFVQKYLNECRSFYSCIYCRTHLANHDELISRSFQGNRSRAYLFNSVINVSCGPSVQRELNTGSHSVADIFCTNCGTAIGWKYEKAFVDSQKYKEGKFIIELAHVVRENRHLELDKRDIFLGLVDAPQKQQQQQQQQQQSLMANATIGTNHQGSLLPTSSSGQWSPGTSSSSSSSSPSSSSSSNNGAASTRPSCRYSSPNSQLNLNDHQQRGRCSAKDLNEDGDDIDDDEVLMFPFYDDLYGNRSSYSNLSTSRSYQKRLRHSLHLDAAPYDWRCARVGNNSPSSVSPTTTSLTPTSLQRPNLTSCPSGSIEIPVNQSSKAQSDNSGSVGCCRHQQTASRRFFASPATNSTPTLPPQPSTSKATTVAFDASVGRSNAAHVSSEQSLNPAASSSSVRAEGPAELDDDGDTQFQFEHDKQAAGGEQSSSGQDRAGRACADQPMDSQAQLGANLGTSTSSTSSGTGVGAQTSSSRNATYVNQKAPVDDNRGEMLDVSEMSAVQSMTRTNSLSFDDEEFYDCNTDHDVSNSSFRPK